HDRPANFMHRARRRGFTLIESAIVLVIVGVGTVATIQLLAAGTVANGDAHRLTTGINLARGVQEMTQSMSFAQVLALDGRTWSPPVDSMGQAQADFTGWQQDVAVTKVDPNRLSLSLPSTTETPMARVTATVTYAGEHVCELTWLAVKTE